ncbi:hypothetical protein HIM_05458 [Hirsutella minnesotensis 3608]|uniref:Ecp2 effector protein domain-containing protein n=1 Tax=Hirsutella minnesotensis 3608 TaxID=1043627 RepID=A0A0F8A5G0_9HYPO|nr:hypothetical protein HIM_05458 [Hirsutella minnesotensis 3608]
MKFAALIVIFSVVAAAFERVSELEKRDWQKCIYDALDKFDQGNDGSDVACDTYACIQSAGEKYSRGGLLNKGGSILVFGCKFNPFTSHHQAAKVTDVEEEEWKQCMNSLLGEFEIGRDDRHTTCQFWRCLQTKSDRYNRGGIAEKLGHLVNIICIGA